MVNIFFLITLTFIEFLKVPSINIMSAKLATIGLLKIMK